MCSVKVHEAKTNLSKLIARAQRGEEVVIARGKTPVVRLVPIGVVARPTAARRAARKASRRSGILCAASAR